MTLTNQNKYNICIGIVVLILVIYLVCSQCQINDLKQENTSVKQESKKIRNLKQSSFTPPGGSSDFMLTDSNGNMYTMPVTNVSGPITANRSHTNNEISRLKSVDIAANTSAITTINQVPYFFAACKRDTNPVRFVNDDNVRGHRGGKDLYGMSFSSQKMNNNGNYTTVGHEGMYRVQATMTISGDNGSMWMAIKYIRGSTVTTLDETWCSLDQGHTYCVMCQGLFRAQNNDGIYMEYKRIGGSEMWVQGATLLMEKIGENY